MKNMAKIAGLILVLATGPVIIGMEKPVNPTIRVYIINEAKSALGGGYEIKVEPKYDLKYLKMGRDGMAPGKTATIPFGKSEYVNQLNALTDILTTGPKAYGWSTNQNMLDKIKKESSGYDNYSEVYLHVVSSASGYYINNWHWAASEEAHAEPTLIEFISVDDIKQGRLGQDYARKATEICKANYTKAVAAGYTNLCTYLNNKLKTDVLRGSSSDIKVREDAIKRIIDGLYEQLRVYKAEIVGQGGKLFPKYVD